LPLGGGRWGGGEQGQKKDVTGKNQLGPAKQIKNRKKGSLEKKSFAKQGRGEHRRGRGVFTVHRVTRFPKKQRGNRESREGGK